MFDLKKGDKVSLNFEIDERITDPRELFNHESVYVTAWNRTSSTAFLISCQFRWLNNFFKLSGIYSIKKVSNK